MKTWHDFWATLLGIIAVIALSISVYFLLELLFALYTLGIHLTQR